MKCPNCDGKGTVLKIIYEDWQKDEIVRSAVKCPRCNGSGEVPMTNEEWLRTCSTEEFAEWIASEINERVKLALHDSELNDGDVDADFYMEDSDDWKEWLKQPHSEVGK